MYLHAGLDGSGGEFDPVGSPGDPGQGWLGSLLGEVSALYQEEQQDRGSTNVKKEDVEKTNMEKEDMERTNASNEDNITKYMEKDNRNRSNMTGHEGVWWECRAEVWQCLSSLMEEGVRKVHGVSDITGWVTIPPTTLPRSLHHLLYKAVFHGGLKSMWSSVMEVPGAQGAASCLSSHDTCVTYGTLRRWDGDTTLVNAELL